MYKKMLESTDGVTGFPLLSEFWARPSLCCSQHWVYMFYQLWLLPFQKLGSMDKPVLTSHCDFLFLSDFICVAPVKVAHVSSATQGCYILELWEASC